MTWFEDGCKVIVVSDEKGVVVEWAYIIMMVCNIGQSGIHHMSGFPMKRSG